MLACHHHPSAQARRAHDLSEHGRRLVLVESEGERVWHYNWWTTQTANLLSKETNGIKAFLHKLPFGSLTNHRKSHYNSFFLLSSARVNHWQTWYDEIAERFEASVARNKWSTTPRDKCEKLQCDHFSWINHLATNFVPFQHQSNLGTSQLWALAKVGPMH